MAEDATAPAPWQDVLFGKGSPVVFAVLDGAVLPGVGDALATIPQARCLFKNDAAEEYEDSAPWLVRLRAGCRFTRSLFTRDPAKDIPWQRWGRDGYVLVQADISFDALWHHLRRFTRVKSPTRKWYLHRFWDPRLLSFVAADFDQTGWSPQVWHLPMEADIHWFEADVLRTMRVPKKTDATGPDHRLFDALSRYGCWMQAGLFWDDAATNGQGRNAFQRGVVNFCDAHGFRGSASIDHIAKALLLSTEGALVDRFSSRLPATDALRSYSIAMAMEKFAVRRGKT